MGNSKSHVFYNYNDQKMYIRKKQSFEEKIGRKIHGMQINERVIFSNLFCMFADETN